jgi:hypothetical protein
MLGGIWSSYLNSETQLGESLERADIFRSYQWDRRYDNVDQIRKLRISGPLMLASFYQDTLILYELCIVQLSKFATKWASGV